MSNSIRIFKLLSFSSLPCATASLSVPTCCSGVIFLRSSAVVSPGLRPPVRDLAGSATSLLVEGRRLTFGGAETKAPTGSMTGREETYVALGTVLVAVSAIAVDVESNMR